MRPPIKFTEAMLPRVAGFTCGAAPWQTEVADWLTARPPRDGAALATRQLYATTWLFETDAGELIGYAALSMATQTTLPPGRRRSVRYVVQSIPGIGVAPRFWGQPTGVPWQERYAARMFDYVLQEAIVRWQNGRPGLLAGQIHTGNVRSLAFCDRLGFRRLDNPTVGYVNVVYDLSAIPPSPAPSAPPGPPAASP